MRKWIEKLKTSKLWNLSLWLFIAVFTVATLMAVQLKQNQLTLGAIEIQIEPREELAFLDSTVVMAIVKGSDSAGSLQGSKLQNLQTDKMEAALEHYPFIENADVSADLAGKLTIKVKQRRPVMRIFNKQGQSYYVAKNGYKMPLHTGFAPRVTVASGEIAEGLADSAFLRTELCRSLLRIADFCANDPFWSAQIEQLYVDNYMDIILIPKIGNHSIVFGSDRNFENKFSMLKTFYNKGLNAAGWDTYKKIDLRFDGQIVAEK